MPSIETIVVVALAGLALSASPGPSMLYVLSRSIGQSRSAGLASAVGLGVGGVLLALAAALGLAAIFIYSEIAYITVKVLGACYLVYLGVRMIRRKDETDASSNSDTHLGKVKPQSFSTIVYQGILVEFLNPKTVLFFMAFIPQFVDPDRGSVTTQMLILGMLVPLTAVPSDIIVSLTGGTIAERLSRNRGVGRLLEWAGGLFLIGLGVRIFFDDF